FNTAQQVGGSLGLAILSTLAASQTTSVLHGNTVADVMAAHVSGYHVAFLGAGLMLAAGVVLLIVGLRRHHLRAVESAVEAGAAPAAV
ncbi:MAG: MFS transporter, partial [Solirubrobacteraceae bacterium]